MEGRFGSRVRVPGHSVFSARLIIRRNIHKGLPPRLFPRGHKIAGLFRVRLTGHRVRVRSRRFSPVKNCDPGRARIRHYNGSDRSLCYSLVAVKKNSNTLHAH